MANPTAQTPDPVNVTTHEIAQKYLPAEPIEQWTITGFEGTWNWKRKGGTGIQFQARFLCSGCGWLAEFHRGAGPETPQLAIIKASYENTYGRLHANIHLGNVDEHFWPSFVTTAKIELAETTSDKFYFFRVTQFSVKIPALGGRETDLG